MWFTSKHTVTDARSKHPLSARGQACCCAGVALRAWRSSSSKRVSLMMADRLPFLNPNLGFRVSSMGKHAAVQVALYAWRSSSSKRVSLMMADRLPFQHPM